MLKDINPQTGDVLVAQATNLRAAMTALANAEAEGEPFTVLTMLAKRVDDAIGQLDRSVKIVDKALDRYLV